MAFEKTVARPGERVDAAGVPTGWTSAAGVIQHMHLVRHGIPGGRGLKARQEARRNRPLPPALRSPALLDVVKTEVVRSA